MNCKIIRLCEKDVCNMAKAEKRCFSHPWSENALLGEIKSSFSDFFGAFCEDEFAGYIGGRTVAGETEIFNVAVLPEFRRKGIGKALIEEFIKTADVVVTGEGRLDGQSVMGKAPVGVAKIAKKHGKRVIAFSGCIGDNARACNEYIDAYFPIVPRPCSLEEAMQKENAFENLKNTAEQVFRLIKV